MSGTSSDQLHRSTLTVYSVSFYWLFILCFWFLFMVGNCLLLCIRRLALCLFLYVLYNVVLFLIVEPDGTFQPRTPEACCLRKQLCQSFPRSVTVWVTDCVFLHMYMYACDRHRHLLAGILISAV